jgi:hypothetical protein
MAQSYKKPLIAAIAKQNATKWHNFIQLNFVNRLCFAIFYVLFAK